jgi:hypothetical protein
MHTPLHTGVTLALPIAPQRSPAVFYSGAFHHTRLNPLPSYVKQHPKFDGLTPVQAAQLAVHIKQSSTNAIAVPLSLAASASAPQLGLASFPGSVRPTTPNRQGVTHHRTPHTKKSSATPPPLAQYDAEGHLLMETRRLQGAPLPSGTGPHAHLVMASHSGMPPALLVPPAMSPFTASAPLAALAPRTLSETPIHAVMEHAHAILDHTHIKGHAYIDSDPWHQALSRAAPKTPDTPPLMPPFFTPKSRTTGTKQLSASATALLNAPGLFSPTAYAGTPITAAATPTRTTAERSRSGALPQSFQRPLAIARGSSPTTLSKPAAPAVGHMYKFALEAPPSASAVAAAVGALSVDAISPPSSAVAVVPTDTASDSVEDFPLLVVPSTETSTAAATAGAPYPMPHAGPDVPLHKLPTSAERVAAAVAYVPPASVSQFGKSFDKFRVVEVHVLYAFS